VGSYNYNATFRKKPCFPGGWNLDVKNRQKEICPDLRNSFLFDDTHPSTFGHCWISMFIQEGLYNAGFISVPPELKKYEKACGALSVYLD